MFLQPMGFPEACGLRGPVRVQVADGADEAKEVGSRRFLKPMDFCCRLSWKRPPIWMPMDLLTPQGGGLFEINWGPDREGPLT